MDDIKPPIEIKTLKEDSIVTIEIPTALYLRIRVLLMEGIPFSSLESALKTLTSISKGEKDSNMIDYHTRTLLYLISKIEDAAEKQGVLEMQKLDRNTGKII